MIRQAFIETLDGLLLLRDLIATVESATDFYLRFHAFRSSARVMGPSQLFAIFLCRYDTLHHDAIVRSATSEEDEDRSHLFELHRRIYCGEVLTTMSFELEA